MAKIDVDELKAELNLTPFGAQGWMQNKNEPCAFCGRGGKWGLLINKEDNVMVYHCWYCNTKTSLFSYLKKINRTDLWHKDFQNTLKKDSLPMFNDENDDEDEDDELPEIELPKRLEPLPVDSDSYLKGRGFTEHHYRLFEPSATNFILERKLRDYIIFKIKMDNRVVAWLARSRKSKEFHIQNLKDAKQGKARLQLR
jgi:transcription elongation factor Elf1